MHNWSSLWPSIRRLLAYSRFYRKSLILAATMLWLASTSEVCGPMIISYFIDHTLPERDFSLWKTTGSIIVFLSLQLISTILRYYQSILFNQIALNIVQRLRTEIMHAALHQPLRVFDNQSVGRLISKVTNDTETAKDLYVTVMATVLRSASLISTMLIAMFILNFKLACISITLFPIVTVVMWLYQYYSTPIVRKMRTYIAEINNCFNEIISGMAVIQLFRQERRFGKKLQKASFAHLQAKMATLRLEGYLLRPLLSLLFALVLCGIMLLFGLSPKGEIGVGSLYAFISYLGRLNEPLIELTSQQSIIQQAAVAGERIFELMDSPVQQYGIDDNLLKGGAIELRNLCFSYVQGSPVLQNISLIAPAKSFIALVGHTGSGKSTLAGLLMGYYPVSTGNLLLDGRPIETLTHRVLRQGIAIVQQDPTVMADTIYSNITLGRKISEQQVWSVLEQVNLAPLVRSLSGGIFTELGEKGSTLSAGQKQLLALARVLVSVPVLLILDEATASMDSSTEHTISHTLDLIRKKTTLLVIAHRLSTIVKADQILVLHRGKVVEQGTHKSLLKARGRYYQMFQLQLLEKNVHTRLVKQ